MQRQYVDTVTSLLVVLTSSDLQNGHPSGATAVNADLGGVYTCLVLSTLRPAAATTRWCAIQWMTARGSTTASLSGVGSQAMSAPWADNYRDPALRCDGRFAEAGHRGQFRQEIARGLFQTAHIGARAPSREAPGRVAIHRVR